MDELVEWVLSKFSTTHDFGLKDFFERSTKFLDCEANYRMRKLIWDLQIKFIEQVPSQPIQLPYRSFGKGVTNTAYLLENGHIVKTSQRKGRKTVLSEGILQTMLHYPDYLKDYYKRLGRFMQCLNSDPPRHCKEYPIPEVYRIFWYKERVFLEYEFTPEMLMEAGLTNAAKIDVILQICVHLMILQESAGFMHRDFHPQNVAVRKRPIPRQIRYMFESREIVTTSYYQIYFIDLETACVNFSEVKLIGTNLRSPNAFVNTCQNRSFDMQVFLSWSYLLGFLPKMSRSHNGLKPAYSDHIQRISRYAVTALNMSGCFGENKDKKDSASETKGIRSKLKQLFQQRKLRQLRQLDNLIEPVPLRECIRELANVQRSYLNIANLPYLYPNNILYALMFEDYRLDIYRPWPLFPEVPADCDVQE